MLDLSLMAYRTTEETLDWYNNYHKSDPSGLVWEPLFILPAWVYVWHRNFAPDERAVVVAVREGGVVQGIAPLLMKGETASIMGTPNVCDYLDVLAAPGYEATAATALLDYLTQKNIRRFDAGVVRPDSFVATQLLPAGAKAGWRVFSEPDEVTLETSLPASWEQYLGGLDPKQRHEVKRKLRRIEEAGQVDYHILTAPGDVPAFMDIFLKMFVESRADKAEFLTTPMSVFFRDLANTMAQEGLLRCGVLTVDAKPLAAVLAFDYDDAVYLYNSGFDRDQSQLSVGILSKAYLIKDSIERGRKKFDFLKGGERYKYHLGGKEVRLLKCRIERG